MQTGGDQDCLLESLEEACEEAPRSEIFEHALHALYELDADVLAEAIEVGEAPPRTLESAEVAQLHSDDSERLKSASRVALKSEASLLHTCHN